MGQLIGDPVVARLRAAGCVFAEDEAAVLRAAAPDAGALEALVTRRVAGEPLEVVVGWAEFCGLRVAVDRGVFVPRRRSELLVRLGVALAPTRPVVVDLCCGTGALGLGIADRVEVAELHASDVDPAAVACARRNLAGRGAVHEGDLYDALPARLWGHVDVLVVNAPYVPSDELRLMPVEARVHEPRAALDGGADGVDLHRRVADGAGVWLSPRGLALVETSLRQAASTAAAFERRGFGVSVHRDDDLDATAVMARPVSSTKS